MPKLKTHSGIKKRIKLTGSGKLLRRHAFRGHLLAKKQASRKRNYAKEFEVSPGDESNIRKMLGA